ncbi:MAG: PHP domain-containing protein [Candidatus Delongbacteria bacterium]|nr:PHP domain-containing protein [Candidatus Delongbacteria bacterium]
MTKYADLHIHSTHSDGLLTVKEIFEYANKRKLKAISITDHDSISANLDAEQYSDKFKIEFIKGIELSSEYNNMDIHLLGYFFDHRNKKLNQYIKKFKEVRVDRAKKIVKLLQKDKIDITFKEVEEISDNGAIARPHLAHLLVKKKYAYNFHDAFSRYLNENSKYYVKKFKISIPDAVNLIHEAGGLVFAAHPLYLRDHPEMIDILIESGIDGLETIHSSYDEDFERKINDLADLHKLLKSGGSDCHGGRKYGKLILGKFKITYDRIEKMKYALKKIKS